jgi:hypothetical protein
MAAQRELNRTNCRSDRAHLCYLGRMNIADDGRCEMGSLLMTGSASGDAA